MIDSLDALEAAEAAASITEGVAKLRQTGLIQKLDVNLNEAHVAPFIWHSLNVDEKRTVVTVLSRYCDARGSTGRITIYDFMSGRKLAEMSVWSGVKFY